jgi:hypothetical protein
MRTTRLASRIPWMNKEIGQQSCAFPEVVYWFACLSSCIRDSDEMVFIDPSLSRRNSFTERRREIHGRVISLFWKSFGSLITLLENCSVHLF